MLVLVGNVAASIGVQVPVWHQLSRALPHAVVVLQQLWTAMPVERALVYLACHWLDRTNPEIDVVDRGDLVEFPPELIVNSVVV